MQPLTFRSFLLLFVSFLSLVQGLTIPNEHRESLGLPLVDHNTLENSYDLLEKDHRLDEELEQEGHHVVLEARRGRGGGSRPARKRPQRQRKPKPKLKAKPKPKHKAKSKPKHKAKPKPKHKAKPKSKPQAKPKPGHRPSPTRSGKSKPAKSGKPKSKTTKNVWPTPAVAHPTTAIDPCGTFIDCSNDASAVDLAPRNVQDYVVGLGITAAPEPTAAPDHGNDKRDIRTQKPKLAGAGVFTIKNLDYPGSGKLFNGKKPAHHAFTFSSNSVKDAKVKDLRMKPARTSDYATEHIVELQTMGMFLEAVTKKNPKLGPFIMKYWNAKLPTTAVSTRPHKPGNGKAFQGQTTFNDLIFNAFGSNVNLDDFVLCSDKINSYKARIWKKSAPMALRNMAPLIRQTMEGAKPSNQYLTAFKMTFGVFSYMENSVVQSNMRNTIRNVETELKNADHFFGQKLPKNANLAAEWRTFIREHLEEASRSARVWATVQIKDAEKKTNDQLRILQKHKDVLVSREKKATQGYKDKLKKDQQAFTKQMTDKKNQGAVIEEDRCPRGKEENRGLE